MPQRTLEQIYGGPPAAPRRSLQDTYGSSSFDPDYLATLERELGLPVGGPQPTPPDVTATGRSRTSVDPERGSFAELFDRIATASPRDWLSQGVRFGSGFLSGIPSAVPGIGTLVGGAIGGGGEALAQMIAGRSPDIPAMAVAAGAGMIPFGSIVKGGANLAGRPLLERAAAVAGQTGANVARGATLGAGQEAAYRFGHGELPGRDYGIREMVLPAAIGGGALGVAGAATSRALRAPKRSLNEIYGRAPAAGAPPEPLELPTRDYTSARPITDDVRASRRPAADPRRAGSPLRDEQPIDLNAPEPLLPDTPADFPTLQGPRAPTFGRDPRRAGSPPYQRSPQALVEEFIYGRGNRGGVVADQPPLPVPDWSNAPSISAGRPPVSPATASDFVVEPPIRRPPPGTDPGEFRMPPSGDVRTAQEALSAGEDPSELIRRFFGLESTPRPPVGPAWPGADDIRAAQGAMEGTGLPRPGTPEASVGRFFGVPEGAPTSPDLIPGQPPAVPSMTTERLQGLLRAGDPLVELPRPQALPRDWEGELRMMLDELESRPFIRGDLMDTSGLPAGFVESAGGGGRAALGRRPPRTQWRETEGGYAFEAQRENPNLIAHSPGAPVFHDIMGGRAGTRRQAEDALRRLVHGGRQTALTDRATRVAQDRLLGRGGLDERYRPGAGTPEPPAQTGVGVGESGLAAAGMDTIDPRVKALWDELAPKWEAEVLEQQQRGDPFVVDRRETLEEFAHRLMTEPPRKLWNRERKLRQILDAERGESGFADPSLLAPIGATAAGGLAGAAMNPDDPWSGAAGGAGVGLAAGLAGRRLMRPGTSPPMPPMPASRALQRIMAADAMAPEELRPRFYSTQGSGTFTGPDIPRGGRFNRAEFPNLASESDVAADVARLTAPGAPKPTDAGFANAELLRTLGGGAAGAMAGSFFEPENPLLGALLGGGAGAVATTPAMQRHVAPYVYDAMLSALALPKNIAGVTGAIAGGALEYPREAPRILREFFSGRTLSDIKSNFSDPTIANRWAAGGDGSWRGPFTRAMGAIDQGTIQALMRAGFTEEQARLMTLTNEPISKASQSLLDVARKLPVLLPFARTGLNVVEQGLVRTPGINRLPAVESIASTMDDTMRTVAEGGLSPAVRRSLVGLGVVASGGAYGALSSEGGPLEGMAGSTAEKALMPGFGLYNLPGAVAASGARAFMNANELGPMRALNAMQREAFDMLPLPEGVSPQEYLARFAPAIGAYLSPVAPREFVTNRGVFDPAIARLPGLNELLLERRGTPAGRRPIARRPLPVREPRR